MVTQNMLCTHGGKICLFGGKIRFVTAPDLTKCLEQIRQQRLLPTSAPISELPYHIWRLCYDLCLSREEGGGGQREQGVGVVRRGAQSSRTLKKIPIMPGEDTLPGMLYQPMVDLLNILESVIKL